MTVPNFFRFLFCCLLAFGVSLVRGQDYVCASAVSVVNVTPLAGGSYNVVASVCLAGTFPTYGFRLQVVGANLTNYSPASLTSFTGITINGGVISGSQVDFGTFNNIANPVFVGINDPQPQCFTVTLTTDALPSKINLIGTEFPAPVPCTLSAPVCFAKPTISGSEYVCAEQNGVVFTRTNNPTSTYYWYTIGKATIIGNAPNNPTATLNFAGQGTDTLILAEVLACGKAGTDTFFINVRPKPFFPLNFDTLPACQFSPFYAPVANPADYIYEWRNESGLINVPPNQNIITLAENGYHTLKLTDPLTGCFYTDSVYVKLFPNDANFSVNNAFVCAGERVTFAYTGTTPFALLTNTDWSFGDGGTDVFPNVSHVFQNTGVYAVQLFTQTAAGCKDTALKFITVYAKPVADFFAVDVCLGEPVAFNGLFSYVASPSALTTYLWDFNNDGLNDNSEPQPNHTYSSAGVYPVRLIVVSGNGCRDTVTKNVTVRPLPAATLIGQADVCVGSSAVFSLSASLSPAPFVQWNFDGGIATLAPSANPNFGPYSVVWSSNGSKQVSVYVSDKGCFQTFDWPINVNATPSVNAGNDVAYCSNDGPVQLNALVNVPNSGLTVQWIPAFGLSNPSVLNPTASPDQTTTYQIVVSQNGCISANDELTVYVNHPPNVILANESVFVCEGQGGTEIGATVLEQNPENYSFQWLPVTGLSGANLPNPVAYPQTTTVYTLTVLSPNGCDSDPQFVTVNVAPVPIADAGADVEICQDGFMGTYLSGSAIGQTGEGFIYSWAPAATLSDSSLASPFATPQVTTVYTLTVYSAISGCGSQPTFSDAATVKVEVRNAPTVSAHPADTVEICLGQSVQLLGAAFGGGPNYTYEWSPATGLSNPSILNPIVTPLLTTTYQLKALSNGCESKADFVTIVVNKAPTAAAPRYITLCAGDARVIEAQISGASEPYTYKWEPATGLSDPTVLQPVVSPDQTTTYTLTVAANGCQSTATQSVDVIVLPRPTVNANTTGAKLVLCTEDPTVYKLNGSVTSNGEPFSFHWSPGKGLSDSTSLTPEVRPEESTYYRLIANIGGCVTVDSVLVQVQAPLKALIANGVNDTVCGGSIVTLGASGGAGGAVYTWTWTDAENGLQTFVGQTLTHSPKETTTYTLSANESACKDTAQIKINVVKAAVADFRHSFPDGCAGLAVTFQDLSENAGSYEWDFGDGTVSNLPNPSHVYAEGGAYTVVQTVKTELGCGYSKKSGEINVGKNKAAVFSSIPEAGDTVVLPNLLYLKDETPNAVSWFWNFGDGTLSTEKSPEHLYAAPGVYFVELTVTDADGCVFQLRKGAYVVTDPQLVIPNVFSPNGDGVNDRWRALYNGVENFSALLTDRWGNRVFETKSPADSWTGADRPEGVYFYRVEIGKRVYTGALTLVR